MVYQILDKDKNLVEVHMLEWALWASTNWDDRIVGKDYVISPNMDDEDGVVSTVYTLNGKFETMCLGNIVEHYTSWHDAKAGHARWLEKAREAV